MNGSQVEVELELDSHSPHLQGFGQKASDLHFHDRVVPANAEGFWESCGLSADSSARGPPSQSVHHGVDATTPPGVSPPSGA